MKKTIKLKYLSGDFMAIITLITLVLAFTNWKAVVILAILAIPHSIEITEKQTKP